MLVLVGCNHRSGPIAFRERLAFREEDIPPALGRLREQHGIAEGLILSTCNRVEIVAHAPGGDHAGLARLKAFLCAERSVSPEQLDQHAYHYMARDAVEHLFRVACGLDSQILGEPQILGQIREAYRVARGSGAAGPVLGRLLDQCLSAAKRVRTETGIARNPVSVAFAAVHLARQIFGDLRGRTALLLGAGKMSELVAEHLTGQGVGDLRVASRTYTSAVELAARVSGRPVHWEKALADLGQADVVVSCTGSSQPILGRSEVARARKARRGQPLFLIDIAVPRDVDPAVNDLDNVYLYDIDGLQDVVAAGLEERRRAAERATIEIRRDVEAFCRWREALDVTPLIVALRDQWLGVGQAEIERFRRKLGRLEPQQVEAVEELTRALLHKILHRPLMHLRRSVERGDMELTSALYREIFGVGAAPAPEEGDAPERRQDETAGLPAAGADRPSSGGKDR